MHPRIILQLAFCALLVVLPYNFIRPLRAGNDSSKEIVFLTLEVAGDEIHLLDWVTVPGTLKPARVESATKGISYVATSATGSSLWQGIVDDPRVVRLEYADPNAEGGIAGRLITRDTANVTIRIPARTDIEQLEFFTYLNTSGEPLSKTSARASLGIVRLPDARQGSNR
jgi:hypothetical protein